MKKNIYIATFLSLVFLLGACNGGGTTAKLPSLKNETDSLNYAYGLFNGDQLSMMLPQIPDSIDYYANQLVKGMREGLAGKAEENPQFSQVGDQVGNWLNQQKVVGLMGDSTLSVNYKLVRQGLLNGIHGKKMQMTMEEAQEYIDRVMTARQERLLLEQFKAEKEEGENFMTENAKKEGIQTTESGLQYEVLKEANGPKPSAQDEVRVHYHGMLIDGSVFDSSVDRGEPAVFGVSQVIRGWIEGLQLMPVGSKYKFYIPYDLAYGANGTSSIPPFSPLVFEVELLEIVK